jgi:flavodoxin
MSKLAIVYHRAHGHTEFIARQVHAGTSLGA